MHGYTMPTEEAIEFCEEIRKAKKLSAMPGMEELSRPRREVLPYGALVLERLLEAARARARCDFSVFGIREGLVYSLLSETERRKDPLLSFCAEYARLRSRSRRARRRAVHLDRCPVRAAGPQGDATRSGACATPPACSPTSAGARIPTTAASRA